MSREGNFVKIAGPLHSLEAGVMTSDITESLVDGWEANIRTGHPSGLTIPIEHA